MNSILNINGINVYSESLTYYKYKNGNDEEGCYEKNRFNYPFYGVVFFNLQS